MDFQQMNYEEFGQMIINRIITLTEQKGLKQLDLASRSDIGQSSLSKILKREIRLTLQHIFKICKALDITPETLLSINNDNSILSSNSSEKGYEPYYESGMLNEQYLNEQVLIRDKNHPAFNGIKNNSFHIYLYSTITSETFLLNGEITFDTKNSSFCKATMVLDTGKIDSDGKPIKKNYSGELIISLTMGTCYCLLTNTDIGEICLINFRHMYLFNRDLECRVGTISSSSSGGNRLPVIQRILISKNPLHVSGNDISDLEFVQGQLRLNNSKILISKSDLEALQNKYVNNTALSEFFSKFKELTPSEEYYLLDEANMKNISITSDIKIEGLGILRNRSSALRYNKVSTKTDEFTFEYICNKTNQK